MAIHIKPLRGLIQHLCSFRFTYRTGMQICHSFKAGVNAYRPAAVRYNSKTSKLNEVKICNILMYNRYYYYLCRLQNIVYATSKKQSKAGQQA